MQVTVRYFAVVRDRLGLAAEAYTLEAGASVAVLLGEMTARHPALAQMIPHVRVAVDEAFADVALVLSEGAEVALIPPVSGGSGGERRWRVQPEPVEVDDVVRLVAGPDAGCVVTFVGTVRDNARGRAVVALEYEAYGSMAEKQFARFGAELAERWPGTRAAVVHRVGRLAVGEASVVLAVASPHRAEGFDACRQLIERLKQDAPIWKRELYEDGSVWVGWGS